MCSSESTGVNTVHDTVGSHVVVDLSGCTAETLQNLGLIQEVMEEGVRQSGATIINSFFHRFTPIGVSGVILLSESHASIHTWPDEGYASIDIYTCGEHVFPEKACNYIISRLGAQYADYTLINRGLKKAGTCYYEHKETTKKLIGTQS